MDDSDAHRATSHRAPDCKEQHSVTTLEALAEQLLRQVAERDVELDEQAERHVEELSRARTEAASAAERAWQAAPAWLRVSLCSAIFVGIALMR